MFALSCLLVACQSSPAWSVRDAAPDDLMVKSWELSDAPPAGELMVVRCEYDLQVAGGRQRAMRELFVSTAGARHAEPIVYVPEIPSPVAPAGKWTLVGCGDSRSQPGYLFGSTWNARELELGFVSGEGVESRIRYFVQRESLASARARVPTLRDLPDTGVWKHLAAPEQVVARHESGARIEAASPPAPEAAPASSSQSFILDDGWPWFYNADR
jgi:hypothetical protein